MLVDSHCHLNHLADPHNALGEARAAGVAAVLCVAVDEARVQEVLGLARNEPGVRASVGQHPDAAAADPAWIEPLLHAEGVVAVGETGLDYHHVKDPAARARQRESFAHQLDLAERHRLPAIVHTRSAERDTLDLMGAFPGVRGVLHCFTESWAMAQEALDLGWYISISGIVTFRNGGNVRDVAVRVPPDRLLVESDAPWLAPVPHRGKENRPAYVRETAEALARLRGETLEALAEQTTANYQRLFGRALDQNASS